MKVKAINKNTNQQFDCEEIEINGFKYYIIDTAVGCKYGISKLNQVVEIKIGYDAALYKGIICSNNPNTDIPKVVDEVERLAHKDNPLQKLDGEFLRASFKRGYNKAKETHPFSEEDMLDFADFKTRNLMKHCDEKGKYLGTKKVFQLWKKQQPKIVYYVD